MRWVCVCVCRILYCILNHPSSLSRLREAAHLIRSASLTSTASTHFSTTWSWSERSTAPWLATAEILKLPKVPGEKHVHTKTHRQTYFKRDKSKKKRKEKSIFVLSTCMLRRMYTQNMCACTARAHIHKLIQSWSAGGIRCVVQIT